MPVCICVCAFVCVCLLPIQRLYKGLPDYFMIGSYVNNSEKAIAVIFILIRAHFGGLRAPYLQTL